MRKGEATCFISYNHGDVDEHAVALLAKWISEAAGPRVKVMLDRNLPTGNDLDEYMRLLEEVDAAVILMTPGYRQKARDRAGGVIREFDTIVNRYKALDARRRQHDERNNKDAGAMDDSADEFALLPILFSGDHEASVPDEIAALKYADMRQYRIERHKGSWLIPDHVKQQYAGIIDEVAAGIKTVHSQRSEAYRDHYEQLFQFLFLELKAEWQFDGNDTGIAEDLVAKMFVKTDAYRRVRSQRGLFLVGRKGSGKSTVAGVLSRMESGRYKGTVPLVADHAGLETLFALTNFERIRSDLRHVFTRSGVFGYAWAILLRLGALLLLEKEWAEGRLRPEQAAHMPVIIEFLDEHFPDRAQVHSVTPFFSFCVEGVLALIERCITEARPEEAYFQLDLRMHFTREHALEEALTAEVMAASEAIFVTCDRRILINLDGFDTAFDEFRNSSRGDREVLLERARFEVDWLRALLDYAIQAKQDRRGKDAFHRIADYCLAIPQDRFMEAAGITRDSYLYSMRPVELAWSGVELAILVRKRIEALHDFRTTKDWRPEQRLAQVMRECEPNVPEQITTQVGGTEYTMPLFTYLLRHTFWRPRDILHFYAKILAVAKETRSRQVAMTDDSIRRIVKTTTFHIINTEFLGEFRSVCTNIRAVLDAFEGQPQALAFAQVSGLLENVPFEFAASPPLQDLHVKLQLLYEVGFLGIRVDERMRYRSLIAADEAFYFNEGDAPLRFLDDPELLEQARFVIHPIFTEYLRLSTSNLPLTLNLSWEYLQEQETIMRAR